MAELQRSQSDQGDNATTSANVSYRSRASSVISTGTKFSISTLPQGHYHIDGMLEASSSRATTRPASLYSVRSTATSLPPYEGHQPLEGNLPFENRDTYLTVQTTTAANDHSNGITAIDQSLPTTPTDRENTLSMHYGRVVRTIDENHARQLTRIYTAHEQELAATRDSVDHAYRQEWKAKNREIERIREEAANEVDQVRQEAAADVAAMKEKMETQTNAHEELVARIEREHAEVLVMLHEDHHAAIEKARHAIEDLWEGRWNDRSKIAAEEAKRVADEMQRRDAVRDEEWISVIRSQHPDLIDGIKILLVEQRMQGEQLHNQARTLKGIGASTSKLHGD